MAKATTDHDLKDLKDRIKELNEKASQLLLFFSFAILGAATVDSARARTAMSWWLIAVFPVLLAVAPVKEIPLGSEPPRYLWIRRIKSSLLWVALLLSGIGVWQFLQAVRHS